MKTDKRMSVDAIDDVLAARLAEGLEPAELSSSQRARMRQRILERALAPAPDGTFTLRASEPGWTAVTERVEIRVLRRDVARGDQTILIRMQPGSVIDAHAHNLDEECYVIEGEIEIGGHCVRHGDMHVARAGTKHQSIRSRAGALLLVRAEIPALGASLA